MTFNLKKFIKTLQTDFKDSLTSKEVANLLEIDEPYTKDTPLSTGKHLILTYLSFKGEKSTTEKQEYFDSTMLWPLTHLYAICCGVNFGF